MPGSRASVFGEAEEFQTALSADGVAGLLVTGRGQFRARMTQVALEGLRLAAVEEQLARIAFVAEPAGMVLVRFRSTEERRRCGAGPRSAGARSSLSGRVSGCMQKHSDPLTGASFRCRNNSSPNTA